ncbi:MAG: multiheme c-type cytochrome [Wenzhouxiangella sp.]
MAPVLANVAGPAYVGSEACASCHESEASAWRGSHHALAWTWPSAGTVVADFDGTEFGHDGMTARFRVEPDDSYHVSVTEKDGTTSDYRVHSVAGIEPLQQYLLETEPGRLQSFDVVWDTQEDRWFHLYPDQDLPPDDALHWTGPYKNWNARCAECHATGFDKGYDASLRRYSSTYSEIGVGCEACHGPGSAHLEWTAAPDAWIAPDGLDAYGFSQSFASTEATIQQCATCHSRREAHDDASPVPGTPFHDSYGLALLQPGLYHADGQILEEVYVHGSFLQSRKYAMGVGCLNCHEVHSGGLRGEGNAVCTQCHSQAGNPDFPSVRKAAYDTAEHHFHAPGSAGAQCINCHAPEQVYMGNDWRADHSFRVPRPDLAAQTGAPDACTSCHVDQSPAWAAEEIAARYPESRHRGPHFGPVLAAGRVDARAARTDLVALARDNSQPGIARATALWLLERESDAELAAGLVPLLSDRDPLVRSAAVRLQRNAPAEARVVRLLEVLDDPVRSVRMAAAQALLGAPVARLPNARQAELDAAMSEWRAAMASRVDFPETHLQLAGVALTLRALPQAEAAFREAVQLDPQRVEAWIMLVRLAAASRGTEAAKIVIEQALAVLPNDASLIRLRDELISLAGDGQ